ncbi:DUF2905 domain-containing protein [Candidatus Chrysopegis kryptomonas]|uniref:DUF2905 domain-containing protein n=1 Tax=Candidatus Chryseopegocella kryptomonas TaxID=1633643 RepID=A0A0P1MW90_9BACT|nr:DUF2905 domain-containing protein [Candidatus Chrysopegis kryptomonas]CUT00209.1 Protein of unknown function (DUF2905) [Candidatus Chrysopegis kryptomonas]
MFQSVGKILMLFGALLFIFGVIFLIADKIGGKVPFIGRLPGDILIQKRNFTFYFPLTTSILVSIILTLILWILSFIFRRH